MKYKNILQWFATKQGRQFTFTGISALAIGSSVTYFLSHTFLLSKYKEIVQMYGLGVEVPVSNKVRKLFEEVMNEMQVPELEKKYIKPFTVFGFDMFHAGCTATRTGAIIGIPSNFSYKTTGDIDKHNIVVNSDQVSWGSDAGKKLLDAMILSEAAQKFAIGREIAHVQSSYIYLHAVFPVSIIGSTYVLTANLNHRMGFLNRPFPLRFILYTLTGLFGFGMWIFLQDFTTISYETESDNAMISLGEEYIKGGIEFYSKLLQRNIALRNLMGQKGEKLYTVTGNDQYMLRQKHLPLTMRKEYFELQLEELKKTKQVSSKVTDEKQSPFDVNTKTVPAV
ncbi:hypothetical protein L9F63_010849 [Diploptera punctata]|uniref:Transmembrane protein 177 n=1 Tax=Diploptera punctata TaxID=6984 RepID=A0AAD8EQ35_DIPPU|nr:hypothetical protein L9F63_010849 [Diploptera punctata]